MRPTINKFDAETILRNCEKQPNGCWNWTATICNRYGQIRINGRRYRSHRVALHVWKNFDLNSNLLVCHTCDNPLCVNPDHLFAGTQKENMQDCKRKGRLVKNFKPGNLHMNAKVTAEQVREMRKLHTAGVKQKDLAIKYNLTQQAISKIITGENWRREDASTL